MRTAALITFYKNYNPYSFVMKKILALLPFLVLLMAFVNLRTTTTADTGIEFFEGSWTEAVAKAKQENKPIFMDIYASWCAPCKLLKKETFTDPDVARYFNANFINVSMDGETTEGAKLALHYQIPHFPTLLIIDTTEKTIHDTSGFVAPKDFLLFGKEGVKKFNH